MFAAASKSFSQLLTPPFRTVLFKSLGLTIGLLIVLIIAIETVFGALVVLPGWLETAIQWVGGLGLVVGSVFLIAPITSLIAGLYLDDIAAEVEKRHYPSDPPGQELPTLAAMGISLKFGLVVIGVNILVLFLLLLPGINIIAFFAANGYLLGREFFELAAFRHLPLDEAKRLRKANRLRVFLSGLAIAGLVSVPILNLLTPLFATAFMVHTYKDVAARQARRSPGAAATSI
ncbi:MAG: sulfate transporter family protein [Methyloligellaceae bacterium]